MVNASSPHTRKMPAVIAVARLRYLGSSSPSSFSKSRFTGIRTNAETAKQRKPLTTGLAVGDSYTKMSQAIADVLGGDLAKAQRIVRTEAHRAISRGFQDVSDQTAYLLRESPYMEVKEWCSAEDGDVRSAHRKLDGVVLPVAEEFEVDGRRAACPCGFGVAELDINCRCFLKYSLVLRSEFEGRRHKATQEQPAAKNTPQVQAGQMTLSTASGQQTPAHAVAVQPTAPPEDGGTGTVYLPEKIKYLKGNYSIAFDKVSGAKEITPQLAREFSDEYDRFTQKFGEMSSVSSVSVEPYGNNGFWGNYNDNSGVLSIFGAGGKEGKNTISKVAAEMKKTGKWSSSSPYHAFRHELGHALQKHLKDTVPDYDERLKKVRDIRDAFFEGLTGLDEDVIMKLKKEALSIYGLIDDESLDEFISECVAEYCSKKPRKMSRDVVAALLHKGGNENAD